MIYFLVVLFAHWIGPGDKVRQRERHSSVQQEGTATLPPNTDLIRPIPARDLH